MRVFGSYDLVDPVSVNVGRVGARARLNVMGDSGCGGKASFTKGTGHLFASMDARLEMLRRVTERPINDERESTLTILIPL